MRIVTESDPVFGRVWMAYDADTYDCDCDEDGFFPTCPIGCGDSEEEAIADLKDQLEDAS